LATTLADARDIVTRSVLRIGTNAVDNAQIDFAIRSATREFFRRVRPLRTVDESLTTTADQIEVDLSALTGFATENLIKVELDYSSSGMWVSAQIISTGRIRELSGRAYPGSNPYFGYAVRTVARGADTYAAIDNDGQLLLYPVPTDVYPLRISYWEEPTSFTLGEAVPASVTLNMPDRFIDGVLMYGVPCYYEEKRAGAQTSARSRAMFDNFIVKSKATAWEPTGVILPDATNY
jgi:hypothetical protein